MVKSDGNEFLSFELDKFFIILKFLGIPIYLFAFVRFHNFSARFTLYVTATDIFAIASLQNLFRSRHVSPAATEILATFVSGTAAVTLSEREKFSSDKSYLKYITRSKLTPKRY